MTAESAAHQQSTPRIIFVNGLHRSGTTVITEAAMDATGGVTLTAGAIAQVNADVRALLDAVAADEVSVDRGVDRRKVSPSLPEEYGWLLRDVGSIPMPHVRRRTAPVLLEIANRLAAQAGGAVVVLKNPWDLGREQALLRLDATACVILLRRPLPVVTASRRRALERYASSDAYLSALMRNDVAARRFHSAIRRRRSRRAILLSADWGARGRLLVFLARSRKLPLDRVAFLSFDELRGGSDGARWASHILDAERFTQALRGRVWEMADRPGTKAAWSDVLLDRLWARVWSRRRAEQAAVGLCLTQGRVIDVTEAVGHRAGGGPQPILAVPPVGDGDGSTTA
jgi:hypothetical protein